MPDDIGDDLHGLLIELERRAASRGEPFEVRWARCRARLVAAFGESARPFIWALLPATARPSVRAAS
jgi:hypothetical protein